MKFFQRRSFNFLSTAIFPAEEEALHCEETKGKYQPQFKTVKR
jgi:hypothetical protein